MDSAADQNVIAQEFKIMFYTGLIIKMDGALVGMKGGQYPIMCATAVVEVETSDPLIIVVVNQAAYNTDIRQHESFLHTDQAKLHGVKLNDLVSCFKDGHSRIGKHSMETEGRAIPLLHDGSNITQRHVSLLTRIWTCILSSN